MLRFSNKWLRDKIASDPDVECEAGPSLEKRPMSYSFTVTADTKAEATGKIREQFDAVVLAQPSHAADKEAAVVAAQTLVRLLAEPHEGDEIYVSMNGSLGWKHGVPEEFLHANVTINTSLRNKSK
jgi:hypothetical protein